MSYYDDFSTTAKKKTTTSKGEDGRMVDIRSRRECWWLDYYY